MPTALGVIGFIAFMAYGVMQIYAGYLGIDHHLGPIWAGVALVASLVFRFTLPITIGSFLGALNVWHWHWLGAALFAVPGLALIVPGVLATLFALVRRDK
jgi:hypothetical protein